ncbi:hypothetical protein ACFLQY_05170 [Verrucomicrobiota bacterium]
MKKIIVALALLAAGSSFSQEVVSSANIVGFSRVSIPRGSRTIVGVPFNNGLSQSPSELFGGQLPPGSKLYVKPKGEPYAIEEYSVSAGAPPMFIETTNWLPNAASIGAGVGVWVEVPADASQEAYDVTFSGDVAGQADLVAVSEGINLLSYPYPVRVAWTNTALAQGATVGDKLYAWNGTGYEVNEYTVNAGPPPTFTAITNWSNPDLILDISKGFWYTTENQSITSVEEPLPYEL